MHDGKGHTELPPGSGTMGRVLVWGLLAALGACQDPYEALQHTRLVVVVQTTGDSLDADGYRLWIDSVLMPDRLPPNGTWVLPYLAPGQHRLSVTEVDPQCLLRDSWLTWLSRSGSSDAWFVQSALSDAEITVHVTCSVGLPRLDGHLLFVTGRDGGGEIYAAHSDGSSPVSLTNNGWSNSLIQVSPDGRRIAFLKILDDPCSGWCTPTPPHVELYLMGTDRTGLVRLGEGVGRYPTLSWSPDGTRVVFDKLVAGHWVIQVASADGSGSAVLASGSRPVPSPDGAQIMFWDDRGAILVINVDGTGLRELVAPDSLGYADAEWKPDGALIALLRRRSEPDPPRIVADADLYVVNADGSGLTRIGAVAGWGDFAWFPEGGRIAFSSFGIGCGPGCFAVLVANADGTGLTQLTPNLSAIPNRLRWSPDGRHLAFVRYHLFVIGVDGTGLTQLTILPGAGFAWSPDRTRIAFADQNDPEWEVYVANADGSGIHNVTNRAGYDGAPAWSPQVAVESAARRRAANVP